MRFGLIPNVCRTASTRQPVVGSPLSAVQRDLNQIVNDFFGDGATIQTVFQPAVWAAAHPAIDVTETENEVHVTAELPGLNENEVHVELAENRLKIHGEKKDERTEQNHQFHRVERSFGSFERVIGLPAEVDASQVQATYKNGVLNVSLPKIKRGPVTQTIPVKTV